jgi:hypothetical protein
MPAEKPADSLSEVNSARGIFYRAPTYVALGRQVRTAVEELNEFERVRGPRDLITMSGLQVAKAINFS